MKKSLHPFHILKEVFDLLPDALVVVDAAGQIMFYNQELSALLGFSSNELIARSVETLIPARYRDRHAGRIAEFFDKRVARKMADGAHLAALKKDGSEIQVDIALSPYEVFGTSYTIAVIREISDKKYLEEKIGTLERTKEELEKFACVVSHDLKAPIKRINMLVDLILKELPSEPGEEVKIMTRYLRQSIDLTEKLIAGILEQARAEFHSDVETLDLDSVLDDVLRSISIPANFSVEVPETLPSLKGNRIQWIQVFLNLVTNAIKYNDKSNGRLRITSVRKDDALELHFADNGTVVPLEKRKSIFQMFYRAESKVNGASHGIGLSIVKKIAEQAGGQVECDESSLGGSEFILHWPS